MTIVLKNKELEKLINNLDMAPINEIEYRIQSQELIKLLATHLEQVETRLEQILDLIERKNS